MHIFGIREQTLSFDVVFSVVAECDHPRADVVFWCRFFRRSGMWSSESGRCLLMSFFPSQLSAVYPCNALHCSKTCAAKHSRYGRLLSTCVHVDMACMRILQQGKSFYTVFLSPCKRAWHVNMACSKVSHVQHVALTSQLHAQACTLKHDTLHAHACTQVHTHTHNFNKKVQNRNLFPNSFGLWTPFQIFLSTVFFVQGMYNVNISSSLK